MINTEYFVSVLKQEIPKIQVRPNKYERIAFWTTFRDSPYGSDFTLVTFDLT